MVVRYDPETLEVRLKPSSSDERRMLTKLLQVLLRGGIVCCTPDNKSPLTTRFDPVPEISNATQ